MENKIYTNILDDLRLEKGWSVSDLAVRIKRSNQCTYNYISGINAPSFECCQIFEKLFDKKIQEIYSCWGEVNPAEIIK